MQDCSVLVMSCDKNHKLLTLFLNFFLRNWPDCSYPVYVSTEKLSIKNSFVVSLNSSAIFWGQRLLESLESIASEFVILTLDDFLIEKAVNSRIISTYVDILRQDSNIGCITLANIPDKKNRPANICNLLRRDNKGNYLLNTQISIWRKSLLKQIVCPEDTPWQAELYGSIRARRFKNFSFYCLVSDDEMPIKYNRGWLVVRGTWNANEIERLKLEPYFDLIFDGKDIVHLGYDKIRLPLSQRIIQKIGIYSRKFFSIWGVYF